MAFLLYVNGANNVCGFSNINYKILSVFIMGINQFGHTLLFKILLDSKMAA